MERSPWCPARSRRAELAAQRAEAEIPAYLASNFDAFARAQRAVAEDAQRRVEQALNEVQAAVAGWHQVAAIASELRSQGGRQGVEVASAPLAMDQFAREVRNFTRDGDVPLPTFQDIYIAPEREALPEAPTPGRVSPDSNPSAQAPDSPAGGVARLVTSHIGRTGAGSVDWRSSSPLPPASSRRPVS